MASWPGSLPQKPLLDSWKSSPVPNVVSTNMEYGPPKRRRRSTAAMRKASFEMNMTNAQFATFETFFEDTLGDGAEEYDWTHPKTGVAISCMIDTYDESSFSDTHYRVSIQIKILPS